MDSIIRQAVREELRRSSSSRPETASSTNQDDQGRSENESGAAGSSRSSFSSRTVGRLSGLLNRMRKGGGKESSSKKRKVVKEHRIQVRWLHYDPPKKAFVPVRQKNGGGNRFIAYTNDDPPSLEEIMEKASALFFPGGKSVFAGHLDEMNRWICDTTGVAIFDFLEGGGGTVEDYLKSNGLYPSSTYFYLRTQPRHLSNDEFEDSQGIPPMKLESAPTASTATHSTKDVAREVCKTCSCTYEKGQTCIRCEQNPEYEESLRADSVANTPTEIENLSDELSSNIQPPSLDEIRDLRMAYYQNSSLVPPTHDYTVNCNSRAITSHNDNMVQPTVSPSNSDITINSLPQDMHSIPGTFQDADTTRDQDENAGSQLRALEIHRSCVCADMIRYFQDADIMNSELVFTIINERGEREEGAGIGVNREVFSLFWSDFADSMTIGERERVPFIRHDHFIKEWGAIGRILVKGYISVSYFPMFLAKGFICYCLFDTEVPDSILLDSFMKYLSPIEEELVSDYLHRTNFPDENDELFDFLERFNCRTTVNEGNLRKVLIEIANQELIQKPHVMIATWQPSVQILKQYPQFQSIAAVQALYDTLKPTNKKVLEKLVAQPNTDGERDAMKFLQRYIRGLDNAKLVQFLRFTTASDVMISNQIEIAFTKLEGAACRPISHTCGPLLELPSTYSNFVELREQFNNILNKGNWEMDIM